METTTLKYAHYLRVSTDKQGIDGYGIDAQRLAISRYVPGAEFIEVESGKRKDRPELLKALAYCKKEGAVLIVAKLDRLARNVAFVSMLMESKVEFICADFPTANKLTIHILAAVAEHEAAMVSTRTKAGLAAAKVRGVKLGSTMDTDKATKGHNTQTDIADRNAAKVRATIDGLVTAGMSLRKIAAQLNDMGVTTPRKAQWTAQAVKNALAMDTTCGIVGRRNRIKEFHTPLTPVYDRHGETPKSVFRTRDNIIFCLHHARVVNSSPRPTKP